MSERRRDPGRDPELRLEVVFSSRSKRQAEEAAARLRAYRHQVRLGLDEHRSRSGRRVRVHQVLVPHGERAAARRRIDAAPVVVDEPVLAGRSEGLRGRVGSRAYDGLTSVALIFGALLVVALVLVLAS